MKAFFLIFLFLGIGLSCTKQDAQQTTQPTNPLNDTQWHGLFSYKGETASRVFTIRLNAGGGFVWQDLSGIYDGNWKQTGDVVTITFRANNIQTTFTLLGTNELSSPKNTNHTVWTIAQLRKIEHSSVQNIVQSLPKTQWSGKLYDYTLSFDEIQAGKVVWRGGTNKIIFGGSPGPGYTMTGPVILSDEVNMGLASRGRFFGVFINDNTMRANFWFYQAGKDGYDLHNSDDFIKKP